MTSTASGKKSFQLIWLLQPPADDEIENDNDIDELPQLCITCRQEDCGSPMIMCDNKTCGEWFHY